MLPRLRTRMYVSGVRASSTAVYSVVESVKLVNGARILLQTSKSPSAPRPDAFLLEATHEQPSLNALTIVLIRSNLRLSHSPLSPSNSGAVTEEMTRKVVRSKRTTSAAEVTERKWERWARREEREGMRWAMTSDQACAGD